MERIAFGFLALSAREFEAYTPKELQWRYEAEMDRENRELERIAQLACWVMSPWSSKPLRVRDLLGSRTKQQKSEDWWDEE